MAIQDEIVFQQTTLTATIADGASLSGAVSCGGMRPILIETPAGMEGAALTFQVSTDGSTFLNLYDELGAEVNIPAGASRAIRLDYMDFAAAKALKIRTGTAGAPTNQAGGDGAVLKVTIA